MPKKNEPGCYLMDLHEKLELIRNKDPLDRNLFEISICSEMTFEVYKSIRVPIQAALSFLDDGELETAAEILGKFLELPDKD